MVLNVSNGQMYGFITHTKNYIKGVCSHICNYCYMLRIWENAEKRTGKKQLLRLDETELKEDLGEGKFIFVGSSTDMFADDVPVEWINKVLAHCNKYPENKYLFQTKNPKRFIEFGDLFPITSTLCITLETNTYKESISDAPMPSARTRQIEKLSDNWVYPIMITIEPILKFDHEIFLNMIKSCKPFQVNIGADSKGHKLLEPSYDEIQSLIKELQEFTIVYEKDNLKRLKKIINGSK